MCDDIIDTDAETKSNVEEIKFIPTYLNEKRLWNTKFLYFTCLLINYYCITDSC